MTRRIILNFHGIGVPRRALEPGEAPYWLSEAQFREALDLIPQAALPVAITFDDGNASDMEVAAPLLAERGLRAQVFVLAGRTGTEGSLSAADLRTLQGMGFPIGSHGIDHLDWRRLSPDHLKREVENGRARLQDLLGAPVEAAAIPFGAYSPRVLRALRRAGYARIFTSDGGAARDGAWLQPRTSLRGDMDPAAVAAILSGREGLRRRLRRAASMRLRRGFL